MRKNSLIKLIFFSIAAVVVGCNSQATAPSTPTSSPSPTPQAQGVIAIGDISNNPSKKIKRYQPMADYLAERLKQFNIGVGEVKVAADMQTMIAWLKSGEVTLYFDSPYPAMIVSDKSGAQPILRRWKDGVAEYNTVFFVMKDSGISSLQDLQGKVIAFDEIQSTSGYMLPKAYLLSTGLKPVEKKSAEDVVSADEVGYIFSDDDENSIQWVISGKVTAAAVDTETFAEIPEENRQAMSVIAQTEKVARHVVMARPGLPAEQIAAIKTILLDMDKTPEGQAVLKEFEGTAKFDDFPPDADITKMRKLYEQVQDR